MGVSVGHLDWSLVPYYRKSFWKHFRDGLYWIDNKNESAAKDICPPEQDKQRSIDNNFKTVFPKAYNYAVAITERELAQGVEGLLHNLNSLQSRSGNQLPFSSINYGTCTRAEGRAIIKAILEGTIKGVGPLHKTAVFPCQILQMADGINKKPTDPNYDLFKLALKCTAKRLYPNYANVNWGGNAGYDKNDIKTWFCTINNLVA